MKAAVCTRYGPPEVLQIREVEKPVPRENEVLIRVRAATVLAGDCGIRSMDLPLLWRGVMRLGFGVRAPRRRVLGQELAGEVESVGGEVTRFKPGDQVFAQTGLRLGAYAEYDCLPEKGLVAMKPSNVGYDEAAGVPVGGMHSLAFLRRAGIAAGQRVLINGAGGSIGTFAVQMSKNSGAHVTAVDSEEKLEMLRSIGADEVVDYAKEDFTKSGGKYDVIFDVIGKSEPSRAVRSLNHGGYYLLGNPGLTQGLRGRVAARGGGRKVVTAWSYRVSDLDFLRGQVEQGRLKTVIDRRYPLEEIAEAHRYVDTGRKKGAVVITVS